MAWHSFVNVLLKILQQLWLQLLSSQGKQENFMWTKEC
jgi:hypothetical protein